MKSKTKTLPTHGFILLEALICLAVLAIVLPMAQSFLMKMQMRFSLTQREEKALFMAKFELSKAETEFIYGKFILPDASGSGDEKFSMSTQTEDFGNHLKKVTVNLNWQTPSGVEKYKIAEKMVLFAKDPQDQKHEKN